jgi:hypothetical protein
MLGYCLLRSQTALHRPVVWWLVNIFGRGWEKSRRTQVRLPNPQTDIWPGTWGTQNSGVTPTPPRLPGLSIESDAGHVGCVFCLSSGLSWHIPNFELYKRHKISLPGQWLLAFRRGFFSIELVNVQNWGVYSISGKRRYGINIRNTLFARIGIYSVCILRCYITRSAFTTSSSQNIIQ